MRRNGATALALSGVVLGMVGLSFAAVPLYRLFCQVTGFGGTTQRAEEAPGATAGPLITVRFNTETASELPWQFHPLQREVKLRLGEEALVAFRATNKSSRPTVGTATFNVTPLKAGPYFDKIQCFCFEEQRLEAGQSVDMPVSFFVDPKMLEDRSTSEIRTITLSYSMFQAKAKLAEAGAK